MAPTAAPTPAPTAVPTTKATDGGFCPDKDVTGLGCDLLIKTLAGMTGQPASQVVCLRKGFDLHTLLRCRGPLSLTRCHAHLLPTVPKSPPSTKCPLSVRTRGLWLQPLVVERKSRVRGDGSAAVLLTACHGPQSHPEGTVIRGGDVSHHLQAGHARQVWRVRRQRCASWHPCVKSRVRCGLW